MNLLLRSLSTFVGCVLFLVPSIAQEDDKWNVNDPGGAYKMAEFTVDEGTWMNLDVSPDGKSIVFDLLGDIYLLPVEGGVAKVLREGLAFEVQPRFSPDGKKICFTSDAGGADNVWIQDLGDGEAKQVTKESFRLLNNGVWTPDGEYLIARKHFTSTRSLGAGELWMYHRSGGSGVQLTKRKNDQQDLGEPSISPDGRYVNYSEDMYPGGYFQYNKDPNTQIYVIKRYDLETGETETVTGGPGGAVRPQISRDGKKLAFVRRVRTKSVLFIRDLETGEEWPLFDGLGKDQQEAWAIFGVYTNFAWTPNDAAIITWGKEGKIWSINVENGEAKEIPFTVNAKHRLQKTVKFYPEVAPEQFDVHVIRGARLSPDGETIVFNAVGHLWIQKGKKGKPERLLPKESTFHFDPSWSPDGQYLSFVSWDDEATGAIWELNLKTKNYQKLTEKKGLFHTPQYSPDGKMITYHKAGGDLTLGTAYSTDTGIYIYRKGEKKHQRVVKSGSEPRFNTTGDRLFYLTGWGMNKSYKSVDLSGNDERTHFNMKYGKQITPSPDNKWVAFTDLHKVYVAAFPRSGKAIDLNKDSKAIPVRQVARDAGINLHWSKDGVLAWTLGNEFYSIALDDRFEFLENAPDSLPPLDTAGLKIKLTLKQDKPEGWLALTNARIITVNDQDKVIESGTILIKENRIEAIGNTEAVKIPAKATIMDMKGKTIMPGLVDVHAHLGTWRTTVSPNKQWSYYANLAYGVTTTHDPSTNSEMVFSQSEMVKAGEMVGPRIFSTGRILYGADGDFKAVINSLEDARSAIRRTKAYGAWSVKSYNQPRREQRQQVMQAARELEIQVFPEGGSFFFHNLSMVADGHTGVEHNIPVVPLYDDVIQFWSATETGNTPTLVVNYGSVNGEYYWYEHTNVWEKERLLAFTPRSVIDGRSRHRTKLPMEEYENGHILTAQSCKKLNDAGVLINLGSHGQLQGLAAHWELWMFHQGGMSNLQTLRAATMNGAKYIGMDKEIGSLEVGKLADLIVLDKNPLEDIFHTETVIYTMINGRIYDASTMNEVGN
ncbi:MAG: amidohydrolase family protein, partial [Bacteroidota bacterium]